MKITIKCKTKKFAKLVAQTLAWQTANETDVHELSEKLICDIKDCLDECSLKANHDTSSKVQS